MAKLTVTVSGPVGSGKSAICGEIEVAMKAIGVPVSWDDEGEKNMTHSDWQSALEMYQPSVVIREDNPAMERTRICRAAEAANEAFGQWMPEAWVHAFIKAFQTHAALATPAASPAMEDANDAARDFWQRWAAKRLEISRSMWLKAANRALGGDMRELRLRVDQIEADPAPIVASSEAASPSPAPAAVEELVARLVEEVNEPTPELRALYADYRAAIASGRLKVDDTALSTLAADKARIEAERDEALANLNASRKQVERRTKERDSEAERADSNYEYHQAAEARASALEGEVERLRGLVCDIAPYIDSIVCYASAVGEHLPNRIARDVNAEAARAALSPAKETTDE